MKKKLVSALLCATMAASLLAGCGSGDTSDTGSSGKKGDAKTEVTNDGKILNIYYFLFHVFPFCPIENFFLTF